MPIDVPRTNIRIFVAPKVASTSIKEFCLDLAGGIRLDGGERGNPENRVHKILPNDLFHPDFLSPGIVPIALIRNPLARFLSLYKDKVESATGFFAKFWQRLDQSGVSKPANAEDLITRISYFSDVFPGLGRHALPQVRWVGNRPQVFERVFQIDKIEELEHFLSDRLETTVTIPRRNQSVGLDPHVEARVRALVAHHYSADYDFARKAGLALEGPG